MTIPDRIQRTRKAGTTLPPGTVCVSRGTAWGNPWAVVCEGGKWYARDEFASWGPFGTKDAALSKSLEKYEKYARAILASDPTWLDPLKAAEHLACFCGIGEGIRCHADILIKLLKECEAMNG